MDWNDLGSAFGQLIGDASALVGDQESADALPPPPPKIVLSQRLQRFANVLLGDMQNAWHQFATTAPAAYNTAEFENDPGQLQAMGNVGPNPFKSADALSDDQTTSRGWAVAYENYYQWVYPYIESIKHVIQNDYTGQAYLDILAYLNVTTDDFKGDLSSYNQFVQPWMDRAYAQHSALKAVGIVPSVPPPSLPADYTNFFGRQLDKALGNTHGENPNALSVLIGSLGVLTFAIVGLGLYLLLRR